MQTQEHGRWGEVVLARSFGSLLDPALLDVPVPGVPRIDCHNCRRVQEKTASPDIKCCDIAPVLPNFLVGEILSEQSHPVIETWITGRRGDPYAIWVPPSESARHLLARKNGNYGHPCPLLIPGQGQCSIYAKRPALCAGYHCYYPDVLWQEAWACFTSTLELWQDAASRYLVTLFSFDLQQMAAFWDQEPESLWSGTEQIPALYEASWQHWIGREREFYLACYQRLRNLQPQQRRDLCDLQRQHTMDRLEVEGKTSSAAFVQLAEEFNQRDCLVLLPQEPSPAMQLRLQKGTVSAEQNECSLHQQESMLLWYLLQLHDAAGK